MKMISLQVVYDVAAWSYIWTKCWASASCSYVKTRVSLTPFLEAVDI